MRADLTPWARNQLDREVVNELRQSEPFDGTFHIGKARTDWRAVATLRGHVLADVRAGSATEAGRLLLAAVADPEAIAS